MKSRRGNERKQSVTMSEIARLAGVSQSTVSRVLNATTPVAPDKYAAVMAVIEKLNYRPNVVAQGLVSGRTSTIGVLARELGSPFYGELLRGISNGLKGTHYHPMIGQGSHIGTADESAVELLLARRVDGLILLYTTQLTDVYIHEMADHTPVVVVGRRVPGQHSVCSDNLAGGFAATDYLINKGHTRIAHISGPTVPDSADRLTGYRKALHDHGVEIDPDLIIEGDFTEASGELAVDRLLAIREAHPFTAIFAANDQTAMGARLALYRRQIDIPNDISLIGYDDLPSSQYMTPPLTTIRQPVYYMGLMAAQAVLAQLDGQQIAIPEFPAELIVRQSVAIGSADRAAYHG